MDEQKENQWFPGTEQYALVITIAPSTPGPGSLRVAAYARVSSRSEDQLNSFAAQNAHHGAHHRQPGVGVCGRVRGQRVSPAPRRKSGTTSNGCWRTAGRGRWTRSW